MAVAFRFGEFQRIHAFSQVPMQERSAFEHAAKLKISRECDQYLQRTNSLRKLNYMLQISPEKFLNSSRIAQARCGLERRSNKVQKTRAIGHT